MYGKDFKLIQDICCEDYDTQYIKFDCGNDEINKYLKQSNDKRISGEGVTYLIINKENDDIIAFYTLSASSLLYKVDENLRGFSSIEIKMFAIDSKYQGLKYSQDDEDNFSDYIFSKIIFDIYNLTDDKIGAEYVVLYAVPDAIHFYERNGFQKINEYIMPIFDSFTDGCELMVKQL